MSIQDEIKKAEEALKALKLKGLEELKTQRKAAAEALAELDKRIEEYGGVVKEKVLRKRSQNVNWDGFATKLSAYIVAGKTYTTKQITTDLQVPIQGFRKWVASANLPWLDHKGDKSTFVWLRK